LNLFDDITLKLQFKLKYRWELRLSWPNPPIVCSHYM